MVHVGVVHRDGSLRGRDRIPVRSGAEVIKRWKRRVAVLKWIWQWGEILHEFNVTIDIPPKTSDSNEIKLQLIDWNDTPMFEAPKRPEPDKLEKRRWF
jgi:hypothetical protein